MPSAPDISDRHKKAHGWFIYLDLGAATMFAKRSGGEGVPVPRQQEAGGGRGSLPRHLLQAGQSTLPAGCAAQLICRLVHLSTG